MSEQTSEPDIEIISSDKNLLKSSNEQQLLPDSEPNHPPPEKKRRIKTHEESGLIDHNETACYNMKFDQDRKRIRKQSAVGKASAKSLEILLNLSPPAKEMNMQGSASLDHTNRGSQKTQRLLISQEDCVHVSDSEADSSLNAQNAFLKTIQDQHDEIGVSLQEVEKESCPLPQVELSNDKPSQPFLELPSSPLSSPSGFSADEKKVSKASKKSKTSMAKKQGPKKKSAAKPKAKRGRKPKCNELEALLNAAAPVSNDTCLLRDSTTTNILNNLETISTHNSEAAPDVSSKTEIHKSQSIIPSVSYQKPSEDLESEKVVLSEPVSADKEIINSKDQSKESDKIQTSSLKSPPPLNHLNSKKESINLQKIESNKKINQKKNLRGLSLPEILASTNPKTHRGLRIGLPKEEKYRLHNKINPKPIVQKQVKKKLKVKRGEYDSGEDDQISKKNLSGSEIDDDDNDKLKNSKAVQFKTCLSDEDQDEDEDKNDNLDLEHEEY